MATDCTQCLTDVLQLLQPDPPIVYTLPGNASSPAVSEHGVFPLTTGVNEYLVPFVTDKISVDYEFLELAVENVVDLNKLSINASPSNRTVSGFNVLLDALPDTDNYRLRWDVLVNTVA